MTAVSQPSGTVTLVLSDIEGSTRLLEELGMEAYRAALGEHRRIVREAYARYSGYEVDYEGDAFFYAFSSAQAAVAAVSEAMAGLDQGPIRIRVGIHTGEPGLDPPKYVGMDVHFAARVMSSAHGGQVVCSASTAGLVEAELSELGEHRLKDIERTVPLYQLGEGSFPPLMTISNTNLPRPASSFLGREAEVAEVVSRIEQGARLLTLTGPGGTGKTRLAIEGASTLVPSYKAGVFWVGLASLRDPALVTETISQSLGAKDGLADHIAERELLLLLDNLEQVIDCAPELSTLLEACPNLTLLVTSRELLRISGEVEYAVPPLAEPEAVSLFCERAQLEPSDEIAELCARLDSLPLAVELAAARTAALTPAQILERLSGRLDLLKGGRDADPRQQTLRGTIEWSYELLQPAEQELFARLSVFAGGCTLEAAEEVCDADLDTLQSLVEKSLVRFTNERYWMLETIREFAGERLEVSGGKAEDLRERHTEWFVRVAERAEPELSGSHQPEWLSRLDGESDNFRRVLERLDDAGSAALADLVGSIWIYWDIRGQWSEGRRWSDAALQTCPPERDARRARALAVAGSFARHAGALGDAHALKTEALGIFREIDDSAGAAWALSGLAVVALEQERYSNAEELLTDGIEHARRAGSDGLLANMAGIRADLALRSGDADSALEWATEALDAYRAVDRRAGVAWCLYLVALCHERAGRTDQAVDLAKEGVVVAQEVGDNETIVWLLNLSAALASRTGRHAEAVELLGATDAVREPLGLVLTGVEADVRSQTEREVVSTRSDGDEAAYGRGHGMTVDAAVKHALASID